MKKTAEEITEGLDLHGRTFLLTGANSGLGFENMRVLALRGARVLACARTLAKAEAAAAQVEGDVLPMACELSDPASIRALLEQVNEPLHAIIANAGIMALQKLELQHGIEAHMFTNHMGHFILVTGLLEQLAADGRVVMLSSGAHAYARGKGIDLDDLSWSKRRYRPWAAYGQSKLANILFAKELARRLPKGQTANAVHPGMVETNLGRHMPQYASVFMGLGIGVKSVEQGAATQIYVASHPEVVGVSGEYYADLRLAKPSALALSEDLATRLWIASEKIAAAL